MFYHVSSFMFSTFLFRPVDSTMTCSRSFVNSRRRHQYHYLTVIIILPSSSISGSQASPRPSLSVSSWSELGTLGQLSHASPWRSLSPSSESSCSGFATYGQLSYNASSTSFRLGSHRRAICYKHCNWPIVTDCETSLKFWAWLRSQLITAQVHVSSDTDHD